MDAYLQMAEKAHYRPGNPGDYLGKATNQELIAEARKYVADFLEEDRELSYWVGCSDGRLYRAFIWTLEALRLMCAGSLGPPIDNSVPTLLEMARAEYLEKMK
jgi:hypothetical protein